MNRCGVCNSPTLTGVICKTHWVELRGWLDRVAELLPDLEDAIGKRHRFGGQSRGRGFSPLPINPTAVEVHADLRDALSRAVAATSTGPRDTRGLLDVLRATRGLLGSAAAPVLYGDLEWILPRLVRVVDKPRSRITLTVPCPECGGGPLVPAMGALKCSSCRAVSTIGAVRGACGD